jgi:hypothetical protein
MSAPIRKYMSKRQRPCDFCRSRKTACRIEGHVPCRLCALHRRQCTFVEAAQPRQRPMTVASNEMKTPEATAYHKSTAAPDSNLFAFAFEFDRGPPTGASPFDHEIVPSAPTKFRQENLASDTSSQNLLFESLADRFFDEFGEAPSPSQHIRTYPTLDRALRPESSITGTNIQESAGWMELGSMECQLDVDESLSPQVLGYSCDMDPYLLRNYQYDRLGAFQFKQLTVRSVCQGIIPTQFLLSQPGMFSSSRQEMGLQHISYEASRMKLETLVSVHTGIRLIALFRRFIFHQYPIFSDDLFPEPQRSPPYLLAAIYMVAQPFAKTDDVLSIELAYETLNNSALFQLINEALQYEAHNPSLSAVQTMLLLVIRPSTSALILESSSKWSLHGQLVSTSQTLGLHYDPSSWNIAPWQISLRRRISSTIYSVDKWLASSLGRPPLITRDAWLVSSLGATDGFACSLNPRMWSEHICYARLGLLLGDVLVKL